MGKTTWTKEELNILKTYYPSEGGAIKERLSGRSDLAIRMQAHRLGIVAFEPKKTKLEPCPFCGSEAKDKIEFCESVSGGDYSEEWLNAVIFCTNKECGVRRGVKFRACPGTFEMFDLAREKTIELWNKRV